MKIKTRMFLGIGAIIGFLMISNLITQQIFNKTSQTIENLVYVTNVKIQLLNDLKNLSDERAILTRDLVIFEPLSEQVVLSKKRLTTTAEEIFNIFQAINEMPFDEEENKLIEEIKENMANANRSFSDFILAIEEEFVEEAVEILVEDFQPKYQGFSDLIFTLKTLQEQKRDDKAEKLFAVQEQGKQLIWIVLFVDIVLFIVLGWLLARSFLRPINAMHKTMQEITKTGELNNPIEIFSKDELGEVSLAMNALNQRTSEAIKSVIYVVSEMSEGRFDERITRDSKGEFLTLKNSVNDSMGQVQGVMLLLKETSKNLNQGKLEISPRKGIELKGQFSEVMSALEGATLRVHETVEDIDMTLKNLSNGDFSNRVEARAYGEFISLKESINQTLENLEKFVEEVSLVQVGISEGDLRELVKGYYHGKMAVLKDSLNSSTQKISGMIAKVGAVTQVVVKESEEIAKSSQEVSTRIQSQALSLEKTAFQMESMTETVRNNAKNALHTREMTEGVQVKLDDGVGLMKKAMNSMENMSQASQKINDIISIIDGIAFQTNLLALNAAVEAARAGEHGRGFAVVAGEVRNLAGKSADAAAEIKLLIENSVRISEESGQYVKKTSDAFSEINQSIDTMGTLVKEISDASIEQSKGIDSVSESVSEMDRVTQQSYRLVKDMAEGTGSLKSQAEELLQLVSDFKIDDAVTKRMSLLQSSEAARQFEKMVEAHFAWKGKIRAFVEGLDIGISYEVATDHCACVLGKWYYSSGQELMHLPLMQQLGEEHKDMHQAIKKVMDAKKVSDFKKIEEGLMQVDKQSEVVVSILHKLMNE